MYPPIAPYDIFCQQEWTDFQLVSLVRTPFFPVLF